MSPNPVPTTATTTIRGVSVLSDPRRPRADVFDLSLSSAGIEIRWEGRPTTHMSWDRVSQWEIAERRDGVLLTLRGSGTVTPLVVPGWTADDLDMVMRAIAAVPAAAPATPLPSSQRPTSRFRTEGRTRRTLHRPAWPWKPVWSWKIVATVVLLGLLATAVTLVLLQSAGVISWSILGPTA
ncbi:MAG: hypothetical protein JO368_03380 [Acidimicrobiales bacterium]|nr:hypothetical protein [Acidimicrobiales bacterium]